VPGLRVQRLLRHAARGGVTRAAGRLAAFAALGLAEVTADAVFTRRAVAQLAACTATGACAGGSAGCTQRSAQSQTKNSQDCNHNTKDQITRHVFLPLRVERSGAGAGSPQSLIQRAGLPLQKRSTSRRRQQWLVRAGRKQIAGGQHRSDIGRHQRLIGLCENGQRRGHDEGTTWTSTAVGSAWLAGGGLVASLLVGAGMPAARTARRLRGRLIGSVHNPAAATTGVCGRSGLDRQHHVCGQQRRHDQRHCQHKRSQGCRSASHALILRTVSRSKQEAFRPDCRIRAQTAKSAADASLSHSLTRAPTTPLASSCDPRMP
jgi:hypothetical protein